MARVKYTFAIIFAAVILVGGALFVYFTHYASAKLDEPANVRVWYVENTMSDSLQSYISRFNSETGTECNVTVTARRFDSDNAIMEAVKNAADNKADMPDIIMCAPDLGAYLKSRDMLADMELYINDWDTANCDSGILKACKYDGFLVSMPVASESEVLVVNTKLFPEAEKISDFEELCSAANSYYDKNKAPLFTVTDYSAFFNCAMAQLGERFKAENPFENENKNVRYIYDNLATSAFKRGYAAVEDEPASLVAKGQLACAVVPSSEAMNVLKSADMNDITFLPVPCMDGGNAVYVSEIVGMSILKSDINTEKGAAIFIKWFTSEEINSAYVGYSGFVPAIGSAGNSADGGDMAPPVVYSELMDVLKSVDYRYYGANPDYAVNCCDFNSIMDNIMKKSLS